MNNNIKFILQTTGAHILTYILCGIIFSTIFNYILTSYKGLLKNLLDTSDLHSLFKHKFKPVG